MNFCKRHIKQQNTANHEGFVAISMLPSLYNDIS